MRIIFQPKIFLTLAQCWMQFYYTQRIFIAVNVIRDAMMRNRPFSLLLHFSMFWWKCNSCKRTPATHTVWRMCTNICMQPFEGDKLSRGLKVLFRHKICVRVCLRVCMFHLFGQMAKLKVHSQESLIFYVQKYARALFIHWYTVRSTLCPLTSHCPHWINSTALASWHIPAGHTSVWFAFANKLQDYS